MRRRVLCWKIDGFGETVKNILFLQTRTWQTEFSKMIHSVRVWLPCLPLPPKYITAQFATTTRRHCWSNYILFPHLNEIKREQIQQQKTAAIVKTNDFLMKYSAGRVMISYFATNSSGERSITCANSYYIFSIVNINKWFDCSFVDFCFFFFLVWSDHR